MKRPVAFGKYLLLDRISVGGMAEVFQAKSFGAAGFEKILAIKRILPSMAEDGEFIEMFIDEAKIAGQLSHPNVCQIFELGKINKSHFIAMEFVWGKDTLQIQNRFRRLRRRMPLSMAAFIAAKACEGLEYAHAKRDADGRHLNIIHRDVSPQNVLVSYEGEVKVIDFGIATAVSRSSKTQAGVLKGKFGYMSPEQVRGLPLDRRSDIFALGTLLYEMCVGERLFTGDGDFAVLEKVRNADVLPPSALNPSITPDLEGIILKALARSADDRHKSAAEMLEELTAYIVSQDPVFSSRHMSAALKDMFAREYRREQELLEEYERIPEDALERYAPAGDSELAVSVLGAPAPPRPQPQPIASSPSFSATDLGGDSFETIAVDDVEQLSADDLQEITDGSNTQDLDDDEGMTRVYDDHDSAPAPAPLPAEPTFIFNAEAGELVHAPDQATVILSGGLEQARAAAGGNGGAAPVVSQGPTVIFDAVGTGAPLPAGTGPGRGVAPLVVPRPSLVKDVLIGVLVAVVVILGVVLWRVFATTSATAPATVVVSTAPPVAVVSVLIDKRPAGMTRAGIPFTRKIAPGEHEVAVRAPEGELHSQKVHLEAGQVKVVHFALAKAVGHLELDIKPDGVRVFIDETEVSAAAVRRPLELSAGTPHEIRIAADDAAYEPKVFSVTLSAGERSERKIELLKAPRVARITSDPVGATVLIDDVPRGEAPLVLRDLSPGKHRVTAKLAGHVTRSGTLRVRDSGESALALKLAPQSAAPPPPAPEKPPVDDSAKPSGSGPKIIRVAKRAPPLKPAPRKPTGRTRPDRRRSGPPGFLVANVSPGWATVIVDGKPTGRNTPIPPSSKLSLAPGPHTVTFLAEGKKFTYQIAITSGEITRLIERLPLGK